MIESLPALHAALLAVAVVAAVACSGLVLAANPKSTSARLHYAYAVCLGWWFVCQAMIATSDSVEAAGRWARLAHLGLGILPAVIYHLNVVLADLAEVYRSRIRVHWALGAGLTCFLVLWPGLLATPTVYAWGPYMRYTGWGALVAIPFVIVFAETFSAYKVSLQREDPRAVRYMKARVFLRVNFVAALALVDFLPTFGLAVYPFGYIVISIMHFATLYGTLKYRLIEITPEFAAEHVLRTMPDGLLLVDRHGRVRVANQAAASCLGTTIEGLIGQEVGAPQQNPQVARRLLEQNGDGAEQEFAYVDELGTERHIRASRSVLSDQLEFPVGRLWVLRDFTAEWVAREEKESLEVGVRSVQKLESLGVMARGIAHDFNNLLLGISGNAELAGLRAEGDPELKEYLTKIEATAHRASELTEQMLTYSGDIPMYQRPVDLNRVVADVAGLIGAAISKKATLSLDLQGALPEVVADPVQLSQVILNLIINASESMEGDVGSVSLRTGVIRPDASFHSWHDSQGRAEPSDHVFLEVRDTGVGMDEATLRRIFDPFFTTKFAGRGLGLASVVGIVRAHRGMTRVTSAPDRGTTFTVAFPRAPQPSVKVHQAPMPTAVPRSVGARGLALLADDEPAVREVTHAMLAHAGYSVIEVADGQQAVEQFTARASDISLVVLDQTMPVLDGREAFDRIRRVSATVPIVLITGYTDTLTGPLDPHTAALYKPFRSATLTARIQEATLA